MNEIWKPITGYEGYYEVSNLGRVRSVNRTIIKSNGIFHRRKGKVLTAHPNQNSGLLQVMLVKHKKYKLIYVHRLVGLAFVNNPYNFSYITHINGCNQDNRAENLRYISKSVKINKKLNLYAQ